MHQRWLQAFHAVARLGSFTAAARRLGVGQPTISTHVKSLEDHFRVELFYRNGRNVSLTPLGRALLDITHGMYGHAEEAAALLNSARNHDVGELRIGAIRPSEAIEIIAAYHAGHPNVMLRLMLDSTPAILAGLQRFECDVGVVGYKPGDARYHSLAYDRHRLLVVMSTEHRLARRRTLRLEHLEGQAMVLRAEGSTTRAALDAALARRGVAVKPVMETNSREAVLRAAASGIGIGVITETEFVATAGVKAVTIDDPAMLTYAYVVCLAERQSRPLISAFLKIAAAKAHR
jgi:aminoethylphosphonate catabolism LysR family transcriptional regulator